MRYEYKYVPVKKRTYEEVTKLKKRLGLKTYDEVVDMLINAFNDYQRVVVSREVRQVMCNDLRESRAVLVGWVKLLKERLRDFNMVEEALKYLIPDPRAPLVLNSYY